MLSVIEVYDGLSCIYKIYKRLSLSLVAAKALPTWPGSFSLSSSQALGPERADQLFYQQDSSQMFVIRHQYDKQFDIALYFSC